MRCSLVATSSKHQWRWSQLRTQSGQPLAPAAAETVAVTLVVPPGPAAITVTLPAGFRHTAWDPLLGLITVWFWPAISCAVCAPEMVHTAVHDVCFFRQPEAVSDSGPFNPTGTSGGLGAVVDVVVLVVLDVLLLGLAEGLALDAAAEVDTAADADVVIAALVASIVATAET